MNVTHMHFEYGARWVWDAGLGEWIAPPRPRSVRTLSQIMRMARMAREKTDAD